MKNKNKFLNHILFNNNKGQVLLFIIVAMAIALSIGVAVSSRTITSTQRTSRIDTQSRAYSAAEGGVEVSLKASNSLLINLISGINEEKCEEIYDSSSDLAFVTTTVIDGDTYCKFNFPSAGGGTVNRLTSSASVKVEYYTYNDVSNSLSFVLQSNRVKEINLENYSPSNTDDIVITWSKANTSSENAFYYSIYASNGSRRKGVVRGNSGYTPSLYENGAAVSANSCSGDTCTFNINDIGSQIYGLRLRAISGPLNMNVKPTGATDNVFPNQGFLITSTGTVEAEAGSTQKVTKTIKVYKSFPYLDSVFDHSLYSGGDPAF